MKSLKWILTAMLALTNVSPQVSLHADEPGSGTRWENPDRREAGYNDRCCDCQSDNINRRGCEPDEAPKTGVASWLVPLMGFAAMAYVMTQQNNNNDDDDDGDGYYADNGRPYGVWTSGDNFGNFGSDFFNRDYEIAYDPYMFGTNRAFVKGDRGRRVSRGRGRNAPAIISADLQPPKLGSSFRDMSVGGGRGRSNSIL